MSMFSTKEIGELIDNPNVYKTFGSAQSVHDGFVEDSYFKRGGMLILLNKKGVIEAIGVIKQIVRDRAYVHWSLPDVGTALEKGDLNFMEKTDDMRGFDVPNKTADFSNIRSIHNNLQKARSIFIRDMWRNE